MSDKKTDSESHLFVYLLSSKDKLEEILVFQEDVDQKLKLIIRIAISNLEEQGLISFESTDGTFYNIKRERAFINQVFINIRDLYHEHTHHDGDSATVADSLLLLSLDNGDREKAKIDILQNCQRKIINYHKLIKDALKVKHTRTAIETIHSLIRQAKGEFIYATNFINLYFTDSEGRQSYISLFENSIRSIDTFYEEVNTNYTFLLTEQQTRLIEIQTQLTDAQKQESGEIKTLTEWLKKYTKWLVILTIVLVILTIVFIGVTFYCSYRQEQMITNLIGTIQNLPRNL